jgi:hypothetical protein
VVWDGKAANSKSFYRNPAALPPYDLPTEVGLDFMAVGVQPVCL